MKTSNYILISFFVFLFGGVFVLFLSSKIHQGGSDRGLFAEEKRLESFSAVVAEPGANFYLRIGEYPRMLSYYEKPDSCSFPEYGIRNDTLFVFAGKKNIKHSLRNKIDIYGNNIKSIVAKENSYMSLQQFAADTLFVRLNNAKLDAFFDKTKSTTALFSIQAVESDISLTGANIGSIDIQLNKTKMHTWNNSIGSLSGSLKNDSHVTFGWLNKISLDVDSTSAYQLLK